jgi:hypothetical protein
LKNPNKLTQLFLLFAQTLICKVKASKYAI